MPKSEPRFAGGCHFRFRWVDGRLERFSEDDPSPIEGGQGADLAVYLDLFVSGDRLVCGRVEVKTVAQLETDHEDTLGATPEPRHINSALWRQLPIGQLVDESVETVQHLAEEMFRASNRDHFKVLVDLNRPGKRPGPQSSLTFELLRNVVAPAFRAGGRKGVVAVQRAMQEAGYPGSGPDGGVTIDQARKAVTKARRMRLLEPAGRRHQASEGEA